MLRVEPARLLAGLAVLASLLAPLPAAAEAAHDTTHDTARDTARAMANAAYDLPFLLDTVAGGPTTDQTGRARTAADFADDLVVVDLVTTHCPSLCVMRALDLAAVAKALPDDVRARLRFVAISVDPADRPADLAGFADGLHLDAARWTFLATDAGQAARIRDAIGRQMHRPGDDEAEPSTNLFLFDRRGRLMQSFGGRALDRARLARDLVALAAFDAASLPSRP